MAAQQTVEERRSRYVRVLNAACALSEFTAAQIKSQAEEKHGQLVMRILGQLTREGVLQSVADDGMDRYRWRKQPVDFSVDSWVDRQLFGTQITQTPVSERPRERLLRCGAPALRTAELLAVLIRTGRKGESALEAGERIANRAGDRPEQLRHWSPAEFRDVTSVVSDAAYCQIQAGIELGRRIAESINSPKEPPPKINSSTIAMEYCKRQFARLAADRRQEEFHIVTLDTKLFPIGHHQITVGTLDASLVHPREVFRAAIRDAASAVLLVHNHPSGDPTPSREDYDVTRTLESAGKIIGIQIIDHIIVAADRAVSIGQLRSDR